jgi:AcrR family transcriptional regulator
MGARACYHETTDRSVDRWIVQRSDIIQAAAQIFRRKGFHGTSMQDIADAVNLQKSSLYYHVPSKQDILLEILDWALDLLIDDMQTVLQSDLPAKDKLRRAIHVYVDRLTEDADLATVLLMEHRSLEPDLQQDHIQRRDRYEALWRRLIEEGIREGTFRNVDPRLTGFALLGVQNWMLTWYRSDGSMRAADLANHFCDLFLKGLLLPIEATER